MPAYLSGYDIGSSSVKAALVDAQTGRLAASASSPDQEMKILSPQPDWDGQNPDDWWQELIQATGRLKKAHPFEGSQVLAIGIAYQMHGLVAVNNGFNVLRPAIIWCASRAASIGQQALLDLGETYCLGRLLNSPGNFTASNLKWVKEHEPWNYTIPTAHRERVGLTEPEPALQAAYAEAFGRWHSHIQLTELTNA